MPEQHEQQAAGGTSIWSVLATIGGAILAVVLAVKFLFPESEEEKAKKAKEKTEAEHRAAKLKERTTGVDNTISGAAPGTTAGAEKKENEPNNSAEPAKLDPAMSPKQQFADRKETLMLKLQKYGQSLEINDTETEALTKLLVDRADQLYSEKLTEINALVKKHVKGHKPQEEAFTYGVQVIDTMMLPDIIAYTSKFEEAKAHLKNIGELTGLAQLPLSGLLRTNNLIGDKNNYMKGIGENDPVAFFENISKREETLKALQSTVTHLVDVENPTAKPEDKKKLVAEKLAAYDAKIMAAQKEGKALDSGYEQKILALTEGLMQMHSLLGGKGDRAAYVSKLVTLYADPSKLHHSRNPHPENYSPLDDTLKYVNDQVSARTALNASITKYAEAVHMDDATKNAWIGYYSGHEKYNASKLTESAQLWTAAVDNAKAYQQDYRAALIEAGADPLKVDQTIEHHLKTDGYTLKKYILPEPPAELTKEAREKFSEFSSLNATMRRAKTASADYKEGLDNLVENENAKYTGITKPLPTDPKAKSTGAGAGAPPK